MGNQGIQARRPYFKDKPSAKGANKTAAFKEEQYA
jgi:hypothetical protein